MCLIWINEYLRAFLTDNVSRKNGNETFALADSEVLEKVQIWKLRNFMVLTTNNRKEFLYMPLGVKIRVKHCFISLHLFSEIISPMLLYFGNSLYDYSENICNLKIRVIETHIKNPEAEVIGLPPYWRVQHSSVFYSIIIDSCIYYQVKSYILQDGYWSLDQICSFNSTDGERHQKGTLSTE